MADFKAVGEYVYNGMTMCEIFPPEVLDRVPDFEFRPDDVLLDTYPKAGTTWLQNIIWLIMNNVDVETSRTVQIGQRFPFMELNIKGRVLIDSLAKMESPRFIKSHLPHAFFKKATENSGGNGPKVVIGMRNVKDVIVSYYHFYRMNVHLGKFDQDFGTFFDMFKAKRLVGGDYFDHVLSWWKERENPNLYFVMFEDMKADPKGEISKLATFLGKTITDAELDIIVKETSFDQMKNNPSTNFESSPGLDTNISKFIRKGQVGDWQNYFTEEQIQYTDQLIKEKLIANGLKFKEI